MKSGVGAGKRTTMTSNKTVSQMGIGGKSAMINVATGSGARPAKGRYPIDSSNPVSSQRIRPTNKTEGTGYKG